MQILRALNNIENVHYNFDWNLNIFKWSWNVILSNAKYTLNFEFHRQNTSFIDSLYIRCLQLNNTEIVGELRIGSEIVNSE